MRRKWMMAALVAATSVGMVLGGVGMAFAKVAGDCSNCHTMHYSQNGTDGLANNGVDSYSGGPYRSLTLGGCVGCHTGPNAGGTAAAGTIPYVLDDVSAASAAANSLAGGNFYWVATAGGNDQTKGHNVQNATMTAADTAALNASNEPPGFDSAIAGAADVNNSVAWTGAARLTCAGVYGCHGDRSVSGAEDDFVAMSGAHHTGTSSGYVDGFEADDVTPSLGNSYRFLMGIRGVEDDDWEYTNASNDHNQYHGVDRNTNALINADTVAETTTISALCAQCHGDFHSNAGGIAYNGEVGNSWLRHPTDIDLSNTHIGSEYAAYTTYSVQAPVASDLDVSTAVQSTIQDAGTDDAIVTCISCHRAHGSAYADLLRWDYTTMDAANGGAVTDGCFTCHTTKDD